MIVTKLYINKETCKPNDCTCENNKCYLRFQDLFKEVGGQVLVQVDPITPEFKDQAEWAIFYCWQQDGICAGSILGRGEPETPEPD